MELRTFDKTVKTNQAPRTTIPFITINERGKMNFSQAARRIFQLEEGHRVLFHQDIKYMNDWYIEFTKESRGYKLVFGVTDTRITSAIAARAMFRSIGKQPQKLTFPIVDRPVAKGDVYIFRIDVKNQIK